MGLVIGWSKAWSFRTVGLPVSKTLFICDVVTCGHFVAVLVNESSAHDSKMLSIWSLKGSGKVSRWQGRCSLFLGFRFRSAVNRGAYLSWLA